LRLGIEGSEDDYQCGVLGPRQVDKVRDVATRKTNPKQTGMHRVRLDASVWHSLPAAIQPEPFALSARHVSLSRPTTVLVELGFLLGVQRETMPSRPLMETDLVDGAAVSLMRLGCRREQSLDCVFIYPNP
jgi:hypothetical protein